MFLSIGRDHFFKKTSCFLINPHFCKKNLYLSVSPPSTVLSGHRRSLALLPHAITTLAWCARSPDALSLASRGSLSAVGPLVILRPPAPPPVGAATPRHHGPCLFVLAGVPGRTGI
uniref:Uncharacterized protein n=1 Tax=Setaria viridis TaxID=4556 RepID=A0A4U6V026_SETVI|nr:hypothetical protein SEVIR_4G187902v2 [Setaria viridis]